MSCGNLNIVNENTTVVTVPENNTITITDLNSCNVVTAIQQITETVQIGVPGPRGVQGPPGPNSLPGGLDTQIQFNSASQFSGSSNFTFDYTTNTLVLTGSMDITGSLTVNTVNVGQNTLNFIDENGIIVNSLSIPSGSTNITISTGSIQTSGSSFFSGSFVGALEGTSSLATSASYALSASYLIGGVDFSTLVTTASFNAFTSSYNTGSFTGSFKGDGSGLTNISASAVVGLNLSQITSGSYSASIANNQLLVNTGVNAPSFTGSLLGTATTASYVSGSVFNSNNLALSASYALTASFALNSGAGGSPFYYQSTAPSTGSSPITGSMWVHSDTGVEYNLIYDGNSYQWVQQTLPVGPQGPQGVSGTNNIDGLTTTTLVGLLQGNGLNVSTLGYTPENVASKSIDGTFAANSDTLYPSQKAVKTYVDNSFPASYVDDIDYSTLMQQRSFFNI